MKDFTRNLIYIYIYIYIYMYIYMKIIVTKTAITLVTNSFLSLFCPIKENKNKNQILSKFVVW